ncbi:hypothetical protein CXG46_17285 [Nocardioides alpinus]|uniref:UDP-N-acetylglucosamine kinase n=3 Tax=Nocardioides alpinus TaxID=748909 RepID=A0ABX4QRG9_9ACTN|nr:hypothetical protein CXG46_17285 [Nocardioides alpinus]
MSDRDPSSEQAAGLTAADGSAGRPLPAQPATGPSQRWRSLAELERATVLYRPTWWRTDIDAMALLTSGTAPGRLGLVSARAASGIVTTTDVYGDGRGAGGYLALRRPVHAAILADCVPGVSTDPFTRVPDRTSPESRRPMAFFTIGAPGAGKTSILRSMVEAFRVDVFRNAGDASPFPETGDLGADAGDRATSLPVLAPYSVIDADRVRQALPEYAYGLGSLVVQQECFDVTYDLVLPAAIDRGEDIVYDTIGRPASMDAAVDRLADAGYDVHLIHAACPEDVCRSRTEHRALRDGRLVDPAMLAEAIQDARESLASLTRTGQLAGWLDVETSDGDSPRRAGGSPPWESAFDLWLQERPRGLPA